MATLSSVVILQQGLTICTLLPARCDGGGGLSKEVLHSRHLPQLQLSAGRLYAAPDVVLVGGQLGPEEGAQLHLGLQHCPCRWGQGGGGASATCTTHPAYIRLSFEGGGRGEGGTSANCTRHPAYIRLCWGGGRRREGGKPCHLHHTSRLHQAVLPKGWLMG